MTSSSSNPYVQRLEKLEAIVSEQATHIAELERIVGGIGAAFGHGSANEADDDELDSKFGNEPVKKDPTDRFWKGQSFVGKRMSECPPEYLDALAKYKDVCAKLKDKDGTETKKKYAAYDRADAARARGWARRLRAGWTPPPPPATPTFGGAASGSSWGAAGLGPAAGGGFLGGAPLAVAPAAPAGADADDDFNFGANVGRPPASTRPAATPTEDFDDDPPL